MPPIRETRARYGGVCLLGAVACIQLSSCSVVGLMTGAVIDARKPPSQFVPTGEVGRFRPGDDLVLHLKDSTQIVGYYVGLARLPAEEYQARYERWRASSPDGALLPALGQRVRVFRSGVIGRREGMLVAFTHDGVEIEEREGVPVHERFAGISTLGVMEGGKVSGRRLRALRQAGGLPVVTALDMDTSEGRKTVGLDDVALVWGPTLHDAARQGLLLGLTADLVIVATVVAIGLTWGGMWD